MDIKIDLKDTINFDDKIVIGIVKEAMASAVHRSVQENIENYFKQILMEKINKIIERYTFDIKSSGALREEIRNSVNKLIKKHLERSKRRNPKSQSALEAEPAHPMLPSSAVHLE